FDLALGMPKRDALELCLKEATELGFRKIFLIRSDYSQMKAPEMERMEKLLVSALEQSNAPFLPLIEESRWEDLPFGEYESGLLLDSQTERPETKVEKSGLKSQLLIVG